MLNRRIYEQLLAWKASPRRKPLILRGARQVGKSTILELFASKEYADYIILNFDEEPTLKRFFTTDLKPKRILQELSLYYKKPIVAGDTLLIFDEIQECPEALNSLKYFCEKSNDIHIAAAGSLLGVKMAQGFPVGKVNFLDLKPLSFFEFLDAINESDLREYLKVMQQAKQLSDPFHEKLLKLLKSYLIIGGMPEAVATFVETGDYMQVREVQKEILDSYVLDFTKHAPKNDVMKIMAIWNLIPDQLAKENKKFIFTAIHKSARASAYEAAIQWLVDAGVIIKAYNIETPSLPLSAYAKSNAFKVYMLDVGLLGAISKLDPRIILEENAIFKEFKGALAENYVAEALHYSGHEFYYWTSAGIAEVDFLISSNQKIYPLEVKSGTSKHKKSLLVYADKYKNNSDTTGILSRSSLRNFEQNANIVNYPLYAIGLFPNLSQR